MNNEVVEKYEKLFLDIFSNYNHKDKDLCMKLVQRLLESSIDDDSIDKYSKFFNDIIQKEIEHNIIQGHSKFLKFMETANNRILRCETILFNIRKNLFKKYVDIVNKEILK